MNVFMSTIAAPRPALAKEGLYDKYIFPTMPTMGLSAKKTYAANPIKNAAIADGTLIDIPKASGFILVNSMIFIPIFNSLKLISIINHSA